MTEDLHSLPFHLRLWVHVYWSTTETISFYVKIFRNINLYDHYSHLEPQREFSAQKAGQEDEFAGCESFSRKMIGFQYLRNL